MCCTLRVCPQISRGWLRRLLSNPQETSNDVRYASLAQSFHVAVVLLWHDGGRSGDGLKGRQFDACFLAIIGNERCGRTDSRGADRPAPGSIQRQLRELAVRREVGRGSGARANVRRGTPGGSDRGRELFVCACETFDGAVPANVS